MLAIAGLSVSSRKYQVVHQASCRYDKSASCAIRVNPKLQACARILAWQWTSKSGVRGSAPPAGSRWREKPVQPSTSIRPEVLLTAKTYGSVFYDKLTPSIARGKW